MAPVYLGMKIGNQQQVRQLDTGCYATDYQKGIHPRLSPITVSSRFLE